MRGRNLALVALSQLQLLINQNQDYATFVTDRLATPLFDILEDPDTPAADATAAGPRKVRTELAVLAAHALSPLFCDDFVKQLPTEFVAQLVPKWKVLQGRSHNQVTRLYVDLFLRAAAGRLHQDKARRGRRRDPKEFDPLPARVAGRFTRALHDAEPLRDFAAWRATLAGQPDAPLREVLIPKRARGLFVCQKSRFFRGRVG